MSLHTVHPPTDPFKLLRDKEAADLLRISRSGVWRLHQKGAFPSVRIGGRTLFRRVDLDTYISQCVQAGEAAR